MASVPLRDLDAKWLTWLGAWRDRFPGDLPVQFYADDGTDSPDEWAEGPHLAITLDWRDNPASPPRALVWPVGVEGWDDLREIGWRGAADQLPPTSDDEPMRA